DAARADLDHPLPEQDLRRSTRQVLPEVVQELVRPPRAVLGLGLSVVERDAAGLPLHVGARHVRGDAPEESLDASHPAEIELEPRPPLLARPSPEVRVLADTD